MNSEEKIKYFREYYYAHREQKNKAARLRYKNDSENRCADARKYYQENKKACVARHKKYYLKNREKLLISRRAYVKNNRKKINEAAKVYWNKKKETDLKFNLNCRMSKAIWNAVRENKANRKWEYLVGYTVDDLMIRLKSTMPCGYSWKDFLDGKLHIDHIIPKRVFNFSRPEEIDFLRCWALDNLRLLPAAENMSKQGLLSEPFQPALSL